jgi:hypothetical protein
VFYQLKKKVRFERHQLEVFSKSHVEKIPDEGGVLSDIMSEDEESGQTRSDKFVGSITGINNFWPCVKQISWIFLALLKFFPFSGVHCDSAHIYDACLTCYKKLSADGSCFKKCGASSTKGALVTLDVEYVDDEGRKDVAMKAFSTEILEIVSSDCLNSISNNTELEEQIENLLPIKCCFIVKKDSNGQFIISQVSHVEHNFVS